MLPARTWSRAWAAVPPASEILLAMSPATTGAANDVPLQRAIPVEKTRMSPVSGRLVALEGAVGEGVDEVATRDQALRAQEFARFVIRQAGRGRPADLRAAGARLEQTMLGPAARQLGEGPVVISPSSRLQGTPWALAPSLAGRPLSSTPSARMWLRARTARAASQTRSFIVGPGLASGGGEVPRLAAADPAASVLRGDASTVDAALAVLDGAQLVHIAAHGHFREDSPLFSSLALADGPLMVYDLERLARPPHRVVLSACEAGVMKPVGGDELLGLAAALLSMGSAGVVSGLVQVNDAATVEVMVSLTPASAPVPASASRCAPPAKRRPATTSSRRRQRASQPWASSEAPGTARGQRRASWFTAAATVSATRATWAGEIASGGRILSTSDGGPGRADQHAVLPDPVLHGGHHGRRRPGQVHADEEPATAHVAHRRAARRWPPAAGRRSSTPIAAACATRSWSSITSSTASAGDGRHGAAGERAEELRLAAERLDVAAAGDDGGDRVAVAHRLAEGDDVGDQPGADERPQVVAGPAEARLHLVGHDQCPRGPGGRSQGGVVRRAGREDAVAGVHRVDDDAGPARARPPATGRRRRRRTPGRAGARAGAANRSTWPGRQPPRHSSGDSAAVAVVTPW